MAIGIHDQLAAVGVPELDRHQALMHAELDMHPPGCVVAQLVPTP